MTKEQIKKQRKEQREETQKKVSLRLCELMELKKVKQADLIKFVNESLGVDTLKSSTMSNYVKGKRPITREHIELFSEYMGTDIGYLLASDNFDFPTYDEYQQMMHILTRISEGLPYSNLLKLLGFSMVPYDDYYTVAIEGDSNIKHAKDFTESELKQFRDYIKECALKYFNEKGGDQDESMKVSVPDITESAPKKPKTSRSKRK